MEKIIKFALKNPTIIFFLILLLLGGGIYSGTQMQIEAMPDITIPFVIVSTIYPGASPDDILETVTKPIEKAVMGISGLTTADSHSYDSMSIVVLQFDYNTDMNKAEQDVQSAINKLSFPEQVNTPKIGRVSFDDAPILVLSAFSNVKEEDLAKVIKEEVQPALANIKGVGSVNVDGLKDTNIYIKLDALKLKEYGLNLEQVKQAILANNIAFPLGEMKIGEKNVPLNLTAQIENIDDLRNLPIVIPPDSTKLLGENLSQMGSAITGLGKGMGEISNQLVIMGNGMVELGTGVKNSTEGTALVAQIELAKLEIEQLQGQLTTLMASTPPDDPKVAELKSLITQKQANLMQLNQRLISWLTMQQQLAATANKSQVSTPAKNLSTVGNAKFSPDKSTTPQIDIKTVKLSDIATISLGSNNENYTRTNQKPAVVLNILKNSDANTLEVIESVKSKLQELEKKLPTEISFNVLYDQSLDIKSSVNGMLREGLLGALFAIIVIALFLRDLRATIVAIVSLPLSILITFLVLPRFNITINIMTLGGFAVAIGRIVDDSIVVIENIYRRLQMVDKGERGGKLILAATKEVGSAITASTITTVAVFLPLAFVSGMVSKFFYPFAITIVISLLASLLVAITIVPSLSKYMLVNTKEKLEQEGVLQKLYKRLLNWSLHHRLTVLALSLGLLVISLGLVGKLPVQFIPADQTKTLFIKQTMPAGTNTEITNAKAREVEKLLLNMPEVKIVQDTVGANKSQLGMTFNVQGNNAAKFMVILNETADVEKTISKIRNELKKLEEGGTSFAVNVQTTSAPADQIEIIVNGNNIKDIRIAAAKITEEITTIPNLINVTNNLAIEKPEIKVKVDKDKAAQKGYTPIMVAGIVRSMLTESEIFTIAKENNSYSVYFGLKEENLGSIEAISDLELYGVNGSFRLKEIADISLESAPVSITQRNGKQFANITAGIMGNNTQGITKEIATRIEAMKDELPQGVTYSFGGSTEQIEESFAEMGTAIIVAIALVYLVMVISFGSALIPLAILFSLPFAGVGGFFALYLAKQSLSMPALIGMLMLIGIVVTNAIVLVDRVEKNRQGGMGINEALLEAGSIRLRPILMTAIATIMALLPLAFGFSEGTLISVSLALVVIGGLTFSTLLTLIIVPIIYSYFERLKIKLFPNKGNSYTDF